MRYEISATDEYKLFTKHLAGSLPETYSELEEKDFIKHSWLFFNARHSCPPQRARGDIHENGSTVPGSRMVCGVYTPLRPSSIQSDSDSSDIDLSLDHITK